METGRQFGSRCIGPDELMMACLPMSRGSRAEVEAEMKDLVEAAFFLDVVDIEKTEMIAETFFEGPTPVFLLFLVLSLPVPLFLS